MIRAHWRIIEGFPEEMWDCMSKARGENFILVPEEIFTRIVGLNTNRFKIGQQRIHDTYCLCNVEAGVQRWKS